jgi:imidazolonepropionase-like amidohydrolase
MKKNIFLCLISSLLILIGSNAYAQKVAIVAEKLFTMSDAGTLNNGVVLIEDGKIKQVGDQASLSVPEGYQIHRAKVASPGLIDAHSYIGLTGVYNVLADQDMDENTDPNTADLRAIDGFNPTEKLVAYALRYGVTTVQVGPGPSNPIAGQAGIFKTYGKTVRETLVKFPSAMMFNLGEKPKAVYGSKNKAPSTRMATAALIRRALNQAKIYAQKQQSEKNEKRPEFDPRKEALAKVVTGEIPAIITGHRSDDIVTALRIAKEFDLRLILDGATEGYLIRDEIKKAGVPVLVAPTMQRLGTLETLNSSYENAAFLWRAGIPFAIQSGFESYVPKTRIVLFEAAIATANQLPEEEALKAITLYPAQILGIDDRLGSLEAGKDADIVLFDGDPLEYLSHVTAVFVNGKVAYSR